MAHRLFIPTPSPFPRGERQSRHQAAGTFRVDAPVWMGEERLFEVLRHIAATSDPVKSVPAILSKADEEVKMSRRLVREL